MRIASPRAGGEYVHHPDDDQHEQILRTFVPEKVLLSADLRILPEPYELVRAGFGWTSGMDAWKLKTRKEKRRGWRKLGIEQTHKRSREFPTVTYALFYQVGGM
jgi:hypothetical protein